jgi:hypothetical protein
MYIYIYLFGNILWCSGPDRILFVDEFPLVLDLLDLLGLFLLLLVLLVHLLDL